MTFSFLKEEFKEYMTYNLMFSPVRYYFNLLRQFSRGGRHP
jgi:hypothetical protein